MGKKAGTCQFIVTFCDAPGRVWLAGAGLLSLAVIYAS